jgi:hypothetical protein
MTHATTSLESLGRLQMCPRSAVEGGVDGAWWPRSTDLGDELPDLLAVFGSWIGPVRRVVYDESMWRSAPSRVIRGSTSIPVDPYKLVAHDTIYLLGTHSRDAVLYVVPAYAEHSSAFRVLCAVFEQVHQTSAVTLRYLLTHPVRATTAEVRTTT